MMAGGTTSGSWGCPDFPLFNSSKRSQKCLANGIGYVLGGFRGKTVLLAHDPQNQKGKEKSGLGSSKSKGKEIQRNNYILRVEGLRTPQLFRSFIPLATRSIHITFGSFNFLLFGLPSLKNTFVDFVNGLAIAVSIMPLGCGSIIMPHPPTNTLHLSVLTPNMNKLK